MVRKQNPNLEILKLAVERLGELNQEMVFIGGCAVGLLITDEAAPPIRMTRDVDAIVQVASKAEYYQLAKKLRKKGFAEDLSENAPLCRWVVENLVLDVMPTDTTILGFGNRWYQSAMENSVEITIDKDVKVQMVSPAYFLITKLEAFDGRGNGDYLLSHDIEDIVAVLDGRPEMLSDVEQAPSELKKELAERFASLLKEPRFLESISGHLPGDEVSQARLPLVIKLIKSIAALV